MTVRATADSSTAIFGLFDGMASLLGMILALAVFGTLRGVVLASVTAAVGAGASMGAGQWLSDPKRILRRAGVMALATLTGSVLPAVPFYFSTRWPAFIACLVIVVAIGCLIAFLRPEPMRQSYIETFAVLTIAAAIAFAAGAAVS